MSRKSRDKVITVRCPHALRAQIRAGAEHRSSGSIAQLMRRRVATAVLAPFEDKTTMPDPRVRPVYLQLERSVLAQVHDTARHTGLSVEYVVLQYLA